jgi:hypothetical protein
MQNLQDPENKRKGGAGSNFLVSLILAIATAVYLFRIEKDAICETPDAPASDYKACITKLDQTACLRIATYQIVDVAPRFNLVLLLLFIFHCVQLG